MVYIDPVSRAQAFMTDKFISDVTYFYSQFSLLIRELTTHTEDSDDYIDSSVRHVSLTVNIDREKKET